MISAALARLGTPVGERGDSAPANALLLLGAALDGHGATHALSAAALLPAAPRAGERGCERLGLPEALSGAATLMADAREAQMHATKNAAMRDLLHTAGWQWGGWMLAGLGLLKLSRRRNVALPGVALAFAVWALAAWVARVPWPFGMDRVFESARPSNALLGVPAPFVLGLLGAAGLTGCTGGCRRGRRRSPRASAIQVSRSPPVSAGCCSSTCRPTATSAIAISPSITRDTCGSAC